MKVVRFNDSNEFLEILVDLFSTQEARYNLLLGIVKRLTETHDYYEQEPWMAVVYEDNKIVLVSLMTTPPRDLLLAAAGDYPSAALSVLADALWQQGYNIHGVNAEKKLSAAFAHLWGHRGAFKPELGMQQRIYQLDRVFYPKSIRGFMRKAEEKDRSILLSWAIAFMEEAMGEVDHNRAEKLITLQIRKGDLYVWEDAQIVSMASKSRETIHGAVVSLVYTPKEHRNQGYASSLVAALSDNLLKQGYQFCALFTDLANPTSNAIYQQIGYYSVTDMDQYIFRKEFN